MTEKLEYFGSDRAEIHGDDFCVTIGDLKRWLVEYEDHVHGDRVAAYLDQCVARDYPHIERIMKPGGE